MFLPTYARMQDGHLQRAVQSALDQTFEDFELLVVDDGSIDGTAQYLEEVALGDPRVRVTRLERNTGLPYGDALKRDLFDPIGMASASVTRAGLQGAKSWARPHGPGRRPFEVNDIYYGVPAAGGVNSSIKDLALWLMAQMGEMPLVLDQRLLDTIHAPLVATPLERRHLRKFLERLDDPMYGLGWRSYAYAGHRVIGHRGGVNGFRSLILFDPARNSGVVALWNSNTWQPGGLEFEVMDMLYRLPFRDWMELDRSPVPPTVAAVEDVGAGDAR